MSTEAKRLESSTNLDANVNHRGGRPRLDFSVNRAERPMETGDLLTLQEVCERLGTHNKRIYVLVQQGVLHPLQRGGKGRVYYAEWEVANLLSRGAANIPYIAA